MQTCNPLTARQWFKLREPINWAISIVVFIPLFFVLAQFFDGLLAFIIAFVAAFCLFFFYLDHRAIRIKCPYGRCREIIETNTPWICGHKGCKNDNPDEFPFIYKCEHCGYQPKAYKCHHCGELIFFTEDEQKTGYAECANYALRAAIVKNREGHQEMMTNKREVVESKGLDVDIGKLDIRLKGIKKVLNPPPPPATPSPRMPTPDDELAAFLKQTGGDEDTAERHRNIVREKYKNDPFECEKQLRLIDEWVRNRLK
jgi:DNA-directed RNA polymerase subunit RPC12/RpoP